MEKADQKETQTTIVPVTIFTEKGLVNNCAQTPEILIQNEVTNGIRINRKLLSPGEDQTAGLSILVSEKVQGEIRLDSASLEDLVGGSLFIAIFAPICGNFNFCANTIGGSADKTISIEASQDCPVNITFHDMLNHAMIVALKVDENGVTVLAKDHYGNDTNFNVSDRIATLEEGGLIREINVYCPSELKA